MLQEEKSVKSRYRLSPRLICFASDFPLAHGVSGALRLLGEGGRGGVEGAVGGTVGREAVKEGNGGGGSKQVRMRRVAPPYGERGRC